LHHDLPLEIRAGAEAQVLVRGPRIAVRAAVEAAAVGIDAVAEAEVGAVVPRKDLARVVLEDAKADLRWCSDPLDFGRGPRVRRIGDGDGAHGPKPSVPVRAFSEKVRTVLLDPVGGAVKAIAVPFDPLTRGWSWPPTRWIPRAISLVASALLVLVVSADALAADPVDAPRADGAPALVATATPAVSGDPTP